jgi:6-phosphofructo-2-kinase
MSDNTSPIQDTIESPNDHSLSPAKIFIRRWSQGQKGSNFASWELSPRFYPVATPSPSVDDARNIITPKPRRPFDHLNERSKTPLPTTPPTEVDLLSARQRLERRNEVGPKVLLVLVGLPARGKSYIAQKLKRYLSWMGFRTKVFNVGNRRRTEEKNQETNQHDASFFDPLNQAANKHREELALETLDELLNWLSEPANKVAMLDATNSTVARRRSIMERIKDIPHLECIFIESICTDEELLDKNVQMKLKSPDYVNMDPVVALADFRKRMANYERAYETIGEEEEDAGIPYIKVMNVGKKITSFNTRGYITSQCVFYLMNMHIKQRYIWITRHGQSRFNVQGRVGGDSDLTESGQKYATALAKFIESYHPPGTDLGIWTSQLKRTIQTAEHFSSDHEVRHLRFLNEIHSGACEGMTYPEIQATYPEEYKMRQHNKLTGRWPGGEAYHEVLERLRPLVIELERLETPILIISHLAVTRTLLSYFTGMDLLEMTELEVPLHTIFMLEPLPYGVVLKRFTYDEVQDTFFSQTDGELASSNSAWDDVKNLPAISETPALVITETPQT